MIMQDPMTLTGAFQAMLAAESDYAQGVTANGSDEYVARLRAQRERTRKLVAAHTYLMLGHLQSGDDVNVETALTQIRALAEFLKAPP